jgi:hypothetical protein
LFGSPGFLMAAAPHSLEIGFAAILALILGLAWIGVAIAGYPVFNKHSATLARGLLALSIAGFAVTAVENIDVMSLVSLSQAYAEASAADQEIFRQLKVLAAALRNWAHFTDLLLSGAFLMLFYFTAFRFRLVPRALAGLGMIAVALQLASIGRPFFGGEVAFSMLAPLGLCQLALSLWLLARGFRHDRRESQSGDSP